MRFFITGTAGFIGFHLARRLLDDGHSVVGYDGMTPYYDVELKRRRHEILAGKSGFAAVEAMLEDASALRAAADKAAPEVIVHSPGRRRALQPGEAARLCERQSRGMLNMLELCRAMKPRHFLFGSTSSVYGMSDKPNSARLTRPTDRYRFTRRRRNPARRWRIPMRTVRCSDDGLPLLHRLRAERPAGHVAVQVRPRHPNDEPIDVFGKGFHERDFTYVGDLVEAVTRLVGCVPEIGNPVTGVTDTLSATAPYREVNIAGGRTVGLMRYIETIEEILGRRHD